MLRILAIGKTKHDFYNRAEEFYLKRIQRFGKLDFTILDGVKSKSSSTAKQIQDAEEERFLKVIKPTDFVVLLDEKGKDETSRSFANRIEENQIQGRNLVFVIGGAYGFSEGMRKRANALKALGKGTMSHELIRTVFLEQVYRAYTILHNHPYHND